MDLFADRAVVSKICENIESNQLVDIEIQILLDIADIHGIRNIQNTKLKDICSLVLDKIDSQIQSQSTQTTSPPPVPICPIIFIGETSNEVPCDAVYSFINGYATGEQLQQAEFRIPSAQRVIFQVKPNENVCYDALELYQWFASTPSMIIPATFGNCEISPQQKGAILLEFPRVFFLLNNTE